MVKALNISEGCQCVGDVISLSSLGEDEQFVILTSCRLLPQKGVSTLFLFICSAHLSNILKENANKRKKNVCLIPSFLSSHETTDHSVESAGLPSWHWRRYDNKKKADRTLNRAQVETIRENTGFTLPVGTRK